MSGTSERTIDFMRKLNLKLFDEGASGTSNQAAGEKAGDAARNGRLDDVRYGLQDDAAEENDDNDDNNDDGSNPEEPTFDELIKGKYKSEYDKSVQKILRQRFNENRQKNDTYSRLNPIVSLLANKYGLAENDIDGIVEAVQNDDAMYEQEALEKGMTVEQLKRINRLENENERLRASVEQHKQREEADRIYKGWIEQGEELKSTYPDFDLNTEIVNEDFAGLLRSGIDVKTAYEVAHHDEIMQGAMQVTAQKVKEKVVNDIRANGSRPRESAAGNNPGSVVKTDPNKWSKEDIREVMRRVERGEKIRL